MDTAHSPLTVTAAAHLLGISRQTASKIVGRLGLGTRLSAAPNAAVVLSPADIEAMRVAATKNLEKRSACKFHSGNDLWRRRKNLQKNPADTCNR